MPKRDTTNWTPIIGVRVERGTTAELDALAAARGISRSDVVRVALDEYVAREAAH
jgi:predicted transcriptional regulator